jgi:Tol biopolymer transport system component
MTCCSRLFALACVLVPSASIANGQHTERINVGTGGAQTPWTNPETVLPAISADGRYVAFESAAPNLVPGDTNGFVDVFVRDRLSSQTTRVSVGPGGVQSNGHCRYPALSADGRYVAFHAAASTLVPGVGASATRIYLHDRSSGVTELVSLSTSGSVVATGGAFAPSVSADGRWVAFSGDPLLAGVQDGFGRAYVRDRLLGETRVVSVALPGETYDGHCTSPKVSADGRFVAFGGEASSLVAGDTNGTFDVFVADLVLGTTEIVSDAPGGAPSDAWSGTTAAISSDGRYVAFVSGATNLVADDTNSRTDVFVRDRQTGETTRASVATGGGQAGADSGACSISADGRYVAFDTIAGDFGPPDDDIDWDIYVRDRELNVTSRVSVPTSGAEANADSRFGMVAGDGRCVAFTSVATNLVAGDTNGAQDVFLHDRDASSFESLCEPGVAGVAACPCGNAPSGPGRGCDNSAASGGAVLSASGSAYLSSDTLLLRASGETATATSILLQGTGELASGAVFGQGVRCVGGALLRLYVDGAHAGSVIVPDPGDPSVSERSAELGDPLAAGATRYYLMYYRDPVVLGGCPLASTFNATQTGRVTWWP